MPVRMGLEMMMMRGLVRINERKHLYPIRPYTILSGEVGALEIENFLIAILYMEEKEKD